MIVKENKIDLPAADPDRVINEIEEIIGIEAHDAVLVSAKTGLGINDLLEQLIVKVPPPKGERDKPLQALIIDSWFDNYLGVVSLVRVMQGSLKLKQKMLVMSTGRSYQVDRVGVFTPKMKDSDTLEAGEVGFVIANIKEIDGAPVGDTLTLADKPAGAALPGFRPVQPRVFAGLLPISSRGLRGSARSAGQAAPQRCGLFFEPETSQALGFGFRCCFLGMLHMEIIQDHQDMNEASSRMPSTILTGMLACRIRCSRERFCEISTKTIYLAGTEQFKHFSRNSSGFE